jgi:hypothetical protein
MRPWALAAGRFDSTRKPYLGAPSVPIGANQSRGLINKVQRRPIAETFRIAGHIILMTYSTKSIILWSMHLKRPWGQP